MTYIIKLGCDPMTDFEVLSGQMIEGAIIKLQTDDGPQLAKIIAIERNINRPDVFWCEKV